MKKKLVIFSGGLDSTSVALMANTPDSVVTLLSFDYGQKAGIELLRAKEFADTHGMDFIIQDISSLKFIFGQTQLTDKSSEIQQEYKQNVVVPLRNSLFLQIAMIYAYTNDYDEVWLGSHLDDCALFKGERMFPDCSPEFFKAFQLAMDMGTFLRDKKVKILTPSLLGMGKIELIKTSTQIDADAVYKSWSCYTTGEKQCGVCDSCRNRKRAFAEAGVEDKTEYEQ